MNESVRFSRWDINSNLNHGSISKKDIFKYDGRCVGYIRFLNLTWSIQVDYWTETMCYRCLKFCPISPKRWLFQHWLNERLVPHEKLTKVFNSLFSNCIWNMYWNISNNQYCENGAANN